MEDCEPRAVPNAVDPNAVDSMKRSRGRRWSPNVWLGASTGVWLRLMCRYHFAVQPRLLPIAVADGLLTTINSLLGLAEQACYGGAIRRTALPRDPVFVLGHWRTGTTWLHELMACDARLAAPTVYECVCPHHFLLSGVALPRLIALLLPEKRVMDEMTYDFGSAFEDEFALSLLGARSPYETLAFPNQASMTPDLFDPEDFSPREREQWRSIMVRFATRVSMSHPGRRLVFKSPPHTCRIPTLLDLFPNACFVHIVRNPYTVYGSTLHTWRQLREVHGYQSPRNNDLPEMVLTLFEHLDRKYCHDRSLIPPGRLCEVRYEQLAHDPVGTLASVYERLSLGDFGPARAKVEEHLARRAGYRTNRFQLSADELTLIESRWGEIIRRLGYERPAGIAAI